MKKPLFFSSSICSKTERACLVYNLNVPIKKQKTRPGSLFKWEAWRILLSQTYK